MQPGIRWNNTIKRKGFKMDKDNKTLYRGIIYGILISILVLLIYQLAGRYGVLPWEQESKTLTGAQSEQKVAQIEALIDKYYLEDVDTSALAETMYAGIAKGLEDPYSVYYTQEEYQSVQESSQGEYTGIGVVMQQNKNTGVVTIVRCYEGAPGGEAGLEAGDIIYKVNDEVVTSSDLTEIAIKIKNSENNQVHLTIAREGEEDYLEFDITKENVEIPLVTHKMQDGQIGYIAITEFSKVTQEQFQAAWEDLQNQGAKKLIVDLRDNPGGLVSSVTAILDHFLDKDQMIVYTEDKNGKREEYKAKEEKDIDVPLVVLVNENSASASEIFAGAIKDYQLGTLVGTTTYGKGIVQQIFKLGDGSALKLTISKYYTPDGNNIHKTGITPDVVVEETEAASADEAGNTDEAGKTETQTPGTDEQVSSGQNTSESPITDVQMQKAIDILMEQ